MPSRRVSTRLGSGELAAGERASGKRVSSSRSSGNHLSAERVSTQPLPALQPRSERTQQRIIAATEALLGEGNPDGITMEHIAERAHVSVGAIYKRFQGKTSLLPLVLERVHERQLERMKAFLALPRWQGAGLAERIAGLLDAFATNQQTHRRLMRALVVGHAQSTDPAPNDARATELMTAIHQWLGECSEQIVHPEPRLALSLGLFTFLQSVQTAILFDRIPPQLGAGRFVAESTLMFQRYLGVAPVGE